MAKANSAEEKAAAKAAKEAEKAAAKAAADAVKNDEGEDEDGDGDPDKLPVRYQEFEIAGKKRYFPLFFMATSKDGKRVAGFNEKGVRVTPWTAKDAEKEDAGALTPAKKVAKDVARSNALRRRNMLPEDYATSAGGAGASIER